MQDSNAAAYLLKYYQYIIFNDRQAIICSRDYMLEGMYWNDEQQ